MIIEHPEINRRGQNETKSIDKTERYETKERNRGGDKERDNKKKT